MIRVSELLKRSANDLNRVVILDNGKLYSFNNKTMSELDIFVRRVVNSFYFESIYFENDMKIKQTMFIEVKGEKKK